MPDPLLPGLLEEWEFFYNNRHCPHRALVGKTPIGRYRELLEMTLCQDDAGGQYQLKQGRAVVREFSLDQQSLELKGCPRSSCPYRCSRHGLDCSLSVCASSFRTDLALYDAMVDQRLVTIHVIQ